MKNLDSTASFQRFCPKCRNYQEETGVCRKFHFIVHDYPGRFIKKCNGAYCEFDPDKTAGETVPLERFRVKKSTPPPASPSRFIGIGILIGILAGILICFFLFHEQFVRHWDASGGKSLLLIFGIFLLASAEYLYHRKIFIVNLVLGAYVLGIVSSLIGLWHSFAFILKTYSWIGMIGGGILGGFGGRMAYRFTREKAR